jgi:hypothetical protein
MEWTNGNSFIDLILVELMHIFQAMCFFLIYVLLLRTMSSVEVMQKLARTLW